MSENKPAQPELVIVRRRGSGSEEGHHGGAWKIAYADFMTAMMAFFLVMWLVNAADKKVLTQVASYFNPIPLSDRISAPKGVFDIIEGAPADEKPKSVQKKVDGTQPPGAVATNTGQRLDVTQGLQMAPRDELLSDASEVKVCPSGASTQQTSVSATNCEAAQQNMRSLNEIAEKLNTLLHGTSAMSGIGLSVRVENEGILISLTDAMEVEMFAVGSAQPTESLRSFLATLSRAIGSEAGAIVIRGHTDNRAFRSDPGGNWALSSSRASTVRDILTKSGVAASRIERIEGYADSKPLRPENRQAPENRRIEVLLKSGPTGRD